MDAVEFFKTVNRLCGQGCAKCPVCKKDICMVRRTAMLSNASVESIEEMVSKVEQWAKEHPIKTRQSEFLKMFPNARIDDSRVLIFCPKDFLPVGARSTYCEKHENCKECRKDYWLTEVTDND